MRKIVLLTLLIALLCGCAATEPLQEESIVAEFTDEATHTVTSTEIFFRNDVAVRAVTHMTFETEQLAQLSFNSVVARGKTTLENLSIEKNVISADYAPSLIQALAKMTKAQVINKMEQDGASVK